MFFSFIFRFFPFILGSSHLFSSILFLGSFLNSLLSTFLPFPLQSSFLFHITVLRLFPQVFSPQNSTLTRRAKSLPPPHFDGDFFECEAAGNFDLSQVRLELKAPQIYGLSSRVSSYLPTQMLGVCYPLLLLPCESILSTWQDVR